MFKATVIADSTFEGQRLVSMEWQYPTFILAEVNTHRVASKSSSSSRAIPTERLLRQVRENPFVPTYWGANKAGMQADSELEGEPRLLAQDIWMSAARAAADFSELLGELGLHKQLANRLLAPFQWTRTIITSSYWDNMFALRRHKDAQPEFKVLADLAFEAMQNSTPTELKAGEWHLPYVTEEERKAYIGELSLLLPIMSSARCARVSYLNHDGSNPDAQKDTDLFEMLAISTPAHMSPLEHVATTATQGSKVAGYNRNFSEAWLQFRAIVELDGWVGYEPTGSLR